MTDTVNYLSKMTGLKDLRELKGHRKWSIMIWRMISLINIFPITMKNKTKTWKNKNNKM